MVGIIAVAAAGVETVATAGTAAIAETTVVVGTIATVTAAIVGTIAAAVVETAATAGTTAITETTGYRRYLYIGEITKGGSYRETNKIARRARYQGSSRRAGIGRG
jgi:hypothetical protein